MHMILHMSCTIHTYTKPIYSPIGSHSDPPTCLCLAIHVGPTTHMGCCPNQESATRTLLHRSSKLRANLSRPYLVHSFHYNRLCLSLLCPLHPEHRSTRCSSYRRHQYLFWSPRNKISTRRAVWTTCPTFS